LLFGKSGSDVISGGGGSDVLFSFSDRGDDLQLFGGPGPDSLTSDIGDDVIDGGDGIDSLSFPFVGSGVTIDLAAGTSTGNGTDTLSNLENVEGTEFDDTILGTDGPNFFDGDFGSDTFDGRGGDDVLFGGRSDHDDDDLPMTTSLTGGTGDDLMVVFRGGGELVGNEGDDTLFVGAPAGRRLDGGDGTDRGVFPYRHGVYADLGGGFARSAACTQSCVTDDLVSIEGLDGGGALYEGATWSIGGDAGPDTLIGDDGPNTLRGYEGDDQIFGGGGDDILDGGDRTVDGGEGGQDELDGGLGTDTCIRGEKNLNCEGSG
jgi:Ca2+-binding RTX toxin-like protein